ncbi:protein BTG3 [Anguilla anguilla]|uniref:protein BTG3 n=1 Tax=Anguilla anguilla TaxID=7936 RepID=UPI0015AD068D|nr:protein BTG3 [Anguilla anguilla]XP_035288057.1 protein BTG3 [Anguilla anguilla]
MKKEIAAVVFFMKRLVRKAEKLETEKVDRFVERLTVALQEKYRGHWYPENPSKGQAFRCIRVNGFLKEDPELLRACRESGVQYRDLGLPQELTLWVDPGEVCCRYGEKNHAFTVASFSGDDVDDKEDVTKKVTSAVEKVTSDYHSGSSSDEESGTREACVTPPFPHFQPRYQAVPQIPYQPVHVWHPFPKKKTGPGKGHGPPHPHFGFRPHARPNPCFRPNGWCPVRPRNGPGYWGSTPNLAHS